MPYPRQQGAPGRSTSPASRYGQFGAQPEQQQQQQQQHPQHSGGGPLASGGELWGSSASLEAQAGFGVSPAQQAELLPPAEDLTVRSCVLPCSPVEQQACPRGLRKKICNSTMSIL